MRNTCLKLAKRDPDSLSTETKMYFSEDHFDEVRFNKMKAVSVALVALAIPLVLCYDEKFDGVDVDKIINDDAIFTGYINCMLDKGPCDLEHSEDFKKILPDVIATACSKCSPIQRSHVRKTVKALGEKKPEDFKVFRAKFDPKGEYEAAFTAFLIGSD